MKKSELLEALQADITENGDGEVTVSVPEGEGRETYEAQHYENGHIWANV